MKLFNRYLRNWSVEELRAVVLDISKPAFARTKALTELEERCRTEGYRK